MNKNDIDYDKLAETPFTDEELAQFKPIEQVMPENLLNVLLSHQTEMEEKGLMPRKLTRGKQKVIDAFKATGQGWQTRINEALLQHIHTSM